MVLTALRAAFCPLVGAVVGNLAQHRQGVGGVRADVAQHNAGAVANVHIAVLQAFDERRDAGLGT